MVLWRLLSRKQLSDHPSQGGLDENMLDDLKITQVSLLFPHDQPTMSEKIAQENYQKEYAEPKSKESIAHLIWRCTRPHPSERPSIEEVCTLYDKWIQQTADQLKRSEDQFIDTYFGEYPLNEPLPNHSFQA